MNIKKQSSSKVIFFTSPDIQIFPKDIAIIRELFNNLKIKINWEKCIYNNNQFLIDVKEHKKFLNYINNNININYIKKLENYFLEYNKKELIQSKKCKTYDSTLQKSREYKIKNIMLDYLLIAFSSIIFNKLKKENITDQTIPELFYPYKETFATKNIISILNKNKQFISNIDININFIKKNRRLILKKLKEIKSIKKIKKSNKLVTCMQIILRIYDNSNYLANAVLIQYFNIAREYNPNITRKNINHTYINHKKQNNNYTLQGKIAFRGNVKGKAKVFRGNTTNFSITKNEILIANETNPSLVPYMIICKGIITEKGGLLSHAAIIARELKIPCIIGVEDAMNTISNGDQLIIKEGIIKHAN